MKSSMTKLFKYQFIIYPAIFMVIWYFAFQMYQDFLFVKIANETMIPILAESLPFQINQTILQLIYGYLFGFSYGTMSYFIQARKFNGLIAMLLIFAIKAYFSIMFAVGYGFVLFLFEIILLPFYFIFKKKNVKRKIENAVVKYMKKENKEKVKKDDMTIEEMKLEIQRLKEQLEKKEAQ